LIITYHFKIKPNKEQEKLLINTLKYSRYLYNHLLDLRIRHYHNYKKSISKGELENYAKFLATTDEFAFLKEIHSHLVQDVVARLDNSYDRFFKKLAGFPKFKNSKKYNSFTFKQPSKINLFSVDGFINISKVGLVKLINHQGLDLKKLNKTTDNEVFRKPIAFSCGLETQANGQLLSNCQTNELQSLVGDIKTLNIKKEKKGWQL